MFTDLFESGYVPDAVTRLGIRALLRSRLATERKKVGTNSEELSSPFLEQLRKSNVAIATADANLQHYEVPTAFFKLMLGARMKYSSCLFEPETLPLDRAEERMLDVSIERAQIQDGHRILELGCGWGSFALYAAERFPKSEVVAVSNSATQREYIVGEAEKRGLKNLTIFTADISLFTPPGQFDRIVSVEMLEHVRNYDVLFERIAAWLLPTGKFFVHIFCHKEFAYPFETEGESNWMGKHFFTGGIMPSKDLFRSFNRNLVVDKQWEINGNHYSRTLELWLRNLDRNRHEALKVLSNADLTSTARVQLQRWRIFLMACSELFRFSGGTEWFVAHYLFSRRHDA